MYGSASSFDQLYRRATIAHAKSNLPDDARSEIDALWQEIHSGFDVTIPENFGPFLAKFVADRHANTSSDERADKLCDSGNQVCNVLFGEIPAWFERRQSRFEPDDAITADAARRYVRTHPQCHAVRDAVEAWDEERQQSKRRLQRVIALGMGASKPSINTGNVPGAPPSSESGPTGSDGDTPGPDASEGGGPVAATDGGQ